MKYSVFLGAAACVSVLTCNAYAQTCGAQPSCADLGYTYTGSTSDCLSPALKCPFNTCYDITNYGSFITINGRKIGSLTGDIKQRTFFYANVSKGDTLYIDANDVNAVFIPYYGN